ncbi:hypothetical protein AMS62_16820 [Bacillus sp. FJAT-18019]|nr:hypothetical protein AMS62_16820 [Bacillus sp. FJAT-18019]
MKWSLRSFNNKSDIYVLGFSRSALQNAASVAAMFLTTEAVIADKPEPEKPAMPDMGGMGGMGGMM